CSSDLGVACCVAMSRPQVHIVAYCGDLGYGAAAGARMLALMLACGIVSRLVSGVICDRIGGLRTLLLGSVLQGLSLMLFLPFDSLASLYIISALFGLVQGGIVPAYAIIVREFFDVREAGVRVGLTLTATLVGMALGGWLSGAIFDWTGSYEAAFVNGIGWSLLNGSIVLFLLLRQPRWRGVHAAGHPAFRRGRAPTGTCNRDYRGSRPAGGRAGKPAAGGSDQGPADGHAAGDRTVPVAHQHRDRHRRGGHQLRHGRGAVRLGGFAAGVRRPRGSLGPGLGDDRRRRDAGARLRAHALHEERMGPRLHAGPADVGG